MLINLCFHGIGVPDRDVEPGEEPYWITEAIFEAILDYAEGRKMAISFDDGNSSDVNIAMPRLVERGLTASFFPIAGQIGRRGRADAAGLRTLRANGMSIGSHGMQHIRWHRLDDNVMDEEFVSAREIIESAAAASVTTVACPFGVYDRRTLARLHALNYQRVYTSDRALADTKSWFQPRYTIRRGETVDDVRAIAEGDPSRLERAAATARITVKQWR
jgi:peptidoglycan/xylan/chitin deacetylase (PgdA/CDA1 family)